MTITAKFPSFVKNSWLADIDLMQFNSMTIEEINLAHSLYNQLDRDYFKAERLDTHGKKDFYVRSDYLDRGII